MPLHSPLQVCHVVASINRNTGGPAVSVVRLAQSLTQSGVRTTLVTLDYPEHGPQMPTNGVELITLPTNQLTRNFRGFSPPLRRKLLELVSGKFGVVHNHGLWMFPNLYARLAATSAAVPLVIKPCGMLEAWSLGRSRSKKFVAWHLFERANLDSARLFHATSEAEMASIRALGLRQPIALVPNGIDLADLSSRPQRSLLENKFPELRGRHWLLFLSRIHPTKGIPELLEAWSGLQERFTDWQLILAGPDFDGYSARMREAAGLHGVANRVTFTGMLSGNNKLCALMNADLFVLPTHSENFGIAIAEALAHECPVITTKRAPWQNLILHRCGWWIEDDVVALRETLAGAMQLPIQERRAMGRHGRRLVEERFSWNRIGEQMYAAYLWCCGRGEKPEYVWTE